MSVITGCMSKLTWHNVSEFILNNYLILLEVVVLAVAFILPVAGAYLSKSYITLTIVAIIFLFMGLKLKTDELTSIVKRLDVVVVCVVSSIFLTPFISGIIVQQLPFENSTSNSSDFNFGPSEFRLGVILFNTAPCTVATGIVMVTQAEGNVVLSIAVSTLANILGCFSTPLLFSYLAQAQVMSQDRMNLVIKIGSVILAPLLVGKLIAMFIRPVAPIVKQHKRAIGLIQSTGICLILWVKLSSSIYNGYFSVIRVSDILVLVALSLALHVLLLLTNLLLSTLLCMERRDVAVMVLLISQKTLVLTAAIATSLPESMGDSGLILVPCFIAHPLQMFVDSFLINILKSPPCTLPLWVPAFCKPCRSMPGAELEYKRAVEDHEDPLDEEEKDTDAISLAGI